MPHFIIEAAGALDTPDDRQEAMTIVANVGAAQTFINGDDIKVRLYPCADFLALDGRTSFLHITVRLLAGRTAEQKEMLACALRDALDERFAKIQSISIEICDMDPVSYKKRLA